jgi:hypothetical protein
MFKTFEVQFMNLEPRDGLVVNVSQPRVNGFEPYLHHNHGSTLDTSTG